MGLLNIPARYRAYAPHVAFALVVMAVAIFVVSVSDGNDNARTATADDQALPAQGTPSGTAVRVLRYVGSGSLPSAISLYDPLVRRAFGYERMAAGFAYRRAGLAGQTITVTLEDSAPQGRLVILRAKGPQGDGEYSFTLRRSDKGWRVIYDSFFGDALAEKTRLAAQERLEPGARKPSNTTRRRAQKEADRVAERYRRLIALR